MKILIDDIRYGLRLIAAGRGSTLLAVLTLALGIGANTTIFTFVNATLFAPLLFKNLDRTVFVWSASLNREVRNPKSYASLADYVDWREGSQSFTELAACSRSSANWTGYEQPERLLVARVTPNFFLVTDAKPILGRTFTPADVASETDRPIVISYEFWQNRFGGNSNAIGRMLTLDGNSYTIVGVVDRKFWFPSQESKLWMPLEPDVLKLDRAARTFYVMGLLKPDVSGDQAQAEIAAISRRLEQMYPATNTGWRVRVLPVYESLLRNEDQRTIFLLVLMTVFIVLLIACANVANLLLARAMGRRREVAIRAAIGASRVRLFRQLITESALLALLGGVAGLLLAFWAGDLLLAAMPHETADPDSIVDVKVFAFTMLTSLTAVMFFGLVPALQTSRADLNDALKKESGKSTSSYAGTRLRNVLVIAQVSMATLLLVVSGLLIRTAIAFQAMDPGYATSDVLTMRIELPENKYASDQAVAAFYREMLDRVRSVGGVQAAGIVSPIPVNGGTRVRAFEIDGRASRSPEDKPWAAAITVSPDYLRTMGIGLVAGRGFTGRDVANSERVAVVNESLAKRYWPAQDPVGNHIRWNNESPWIAIVGIARDVRHIHPLREPGPQLFLPHAQDPNRAMALMVRARLEPTALTGDVRNSVWSIDKDQPVYDIFTMQERIDEDLQGAKTIVSLLVIFAAVAFVLASIGIYGVVSCAVNMRLHELGVRMALGAQRQHVIWMVLRQGFLLVGVGLSIGMIGALGVTRLMESLLTMVGVSSRDLWTFGGAAFVLSAAGIVASYFPARHATKVDPMVALRYE